MREISRVLAATACRATVAFATVALARGAAAQATPDSLRADSLAADSLRAARSCQGKVITDVAIVTRPPTIVGRAPVAWRRFVRRALFQSAETRAGVIRPFLLARAGMTCTDELLRETARALRSRPFVAAATVRAAVDSADSSSVSVVVETVDEVPLVIGGGWGSGGPSSFTFGNSNYRGLGIEMVGRWRQGGAFRDGLGIAFRKHGLLGQPVVLSLDMVRHPLGDQLAYSATVPFISDLQRVAWHVGVEQGNTYHSLRRESGPTVLMPVERDVVTAGVVTRVARRDRGVLLGPVAMFERSRPAENGVVATDGELVEPDTDALVGRYPSYTSTRVGAAAGIRLLSFRVAQGFDALLGEQDIARGVQIGTILARGVGGDDRDDFSSTDLFAGVGGPSSWLGLRLHGEGERDRSEDEWRAIVASGRLAWYAKSSETRTFVSSLEFTGGWRERLPLQLSLGDARAGLRGYKGSTLAGGRRAVLRLEQRRVLGSFGRLGEAGLALFGDLGKTWSGSVPFGETTIARASVGSGLLLAVPARSRRLIRADVAVPVTPGAPKWVVFRLAVTDAARTFWQTPSDVAGVRAAAPPSAVFGWP